MHDVHVRGNICFDFFFSLCEHNIYVEIKFIYVNN